MKTDHTYTHTHPTRLLIQLDLLLTRIFSQDTYYLLLKLRREQIFCCNFYFSPRHIVHEKQQKKIFNGRGLLVNVMKCAIKTVVIIF